MPSTWERWGVDADGDGLAEPVERRGRDRRRRALPRRLRRRDRHLARRSSPTTTPSGTSTRCSSWRSSSAAAGWTRPSTSTGMQVSLEQNRKAVVHANRKVLRAERDLRALSRRAGRRFAAERRPRACSPTGSRSTSAPCSSAFGVSAAAGARRRAAGRSSAQARRRSRPGPRPLALGLVRPGRRLAARRARLRRPVRLPGRRRPLASSRSRTTITTTPRPTSPRRRARRSTRSPTASSCAPGNARRALRHRPDDRRRRRPGRGRTATCRTSTRPSPRGRSSPRAPRSASSG